MAWPECRCRINNSGLEIDDPRLAITTAMPASQRWASVLRLARWLFDPGQSPNEDLLATKNPARADTLCISIPQVARTAHLNFKETAPITASLFLQVVSAIKQTHLPQPS